jgi:hypothetical protein
MIDDVMTALYNKFKTNTSLKALLDGGWWHTEAPDEVIGNYVVVDANTMLFDEMMGAADNSIKDASIIINVFVQSINGSAVMADVTTKIRNMLNWQSLTIGDNNFISCQVIGIDSVTKDRDYWQSVISLNIKYQ